MNPSRTLIALALSTLLAPVALAQDAAALSSFQSSLDTTYIISLENTWNTLTTYEPTLEELDLSWDEQLDIVEELAETGTTSSAELEGYEVPAIDVEGLLFTEIHSALGGAELGSGRSVGDWAAQGYLPVRTPTGIRAAYMPTEVPLIQELQATRDSMVMAIDLSAMGLDTDGDSVAAVFIDEELLTLPVDEPLLDYGELIGLDTAVSDDGDDSTYSGSSSAGTGTSPDAGTSSTDSGDPGTSSEDDGRGDSRSGRDSGR